MRDSASELLSFTFNREKEQWTRDLTVLLCKNNRREEPIEIERRFSIERETFDESEDKEKF